MGEKETSIRKIFDNVKKHKSDILELLYSENKEDMKKTVFTMK